MTLLEITNSSKVMSLLEVTVFLAKMTYLKIFFSRNIVLNTCTGNICTKDAYMGAISNKSVCVKSNYVIKHLGINL